MLKIHPEQILDNLPYRIYAIQKNGQVIYVNNTLFQFWGKIDLETLLSFNVFNLYKDNVINTCITYETLTHNKPQTQPQTYKIPNYPDGIQMVTTQIPITDSDGSIMYIIGIINHTNSSNQNTAALTETSLSRQIVKLFHPASLPIAEDIKTKRLLQTIEQIADTDASILLSGESGTGKEVFADYIHKCSKRSRNKLIKINCAYYQEQLLEAELFGYVKGAFTGASSSGKKGLIEEANHGTLFLDEVNSMPLAMQGKLLRVLDTKKIRRLGSNEEINVDFRLISASNENMEQLIQEKRFREDLFYRLAIVPLTIPPLRERKGDIIPLCEYFLDICRQKYNIHKSFSAEIYSQLMDKPWRGNVRELRNFVERAVLLSNPFTDCITKLPPAISNSPVKQSSPLLGCQSEDALFQSTYNTEKNLKTQSAEYERWLIEQAIAQYGSLQAAAAHLGIDKTTLLRKRKHS